jgi:hypothetical protein
LLIPYVGPSSPGRERFSGWLVRGLCRTSIRHSSLKMKSDPSESPSAGIVSFGLMPSRPRQFRDAVLANDAFSQSAFHTVLLSAHPHLAMPIWLKPQNLHRRPTSRRMTFKVVTRPLALAPTESAIAEGASAVEGAQLSLRAIRWLNNGQGLRLVSQLKPQ